MLPQKEFYYLRHGQTDYNLNHIAADHPPDIPLNQTGRDQALAIAPMIAKLPIKTICYSPMLRATQTKEIVASQIAVPQFEIPHLSECSAFVWQHLFLAKAETLKAHPEQSVAEFLQRVLEGLQKVLCYDAPILIVAHGGVHLALCSLLNITNHPWLIDHCVPVHFFSKNERWHANKIILDF